MFGKSGISRGFGMGMDEDGGRTGEVVYNEANLGGSVEMIA